MREHAVVILSIVCAVAGAPWTLAQTPSDLRVGHWVKAKGALLSDGSFAADEIEVLAPEEHQSLTGTVAAMRSAARCELLGQEVHIAPKTEWRGVTAAGLVGARVKIEGDYRGPRKFAADTISQRDAGRDAIEGRIDGIARAGSGIELTILRYRVVVPSDAKVECEGVLGALALAPPQVFATGTQQHDEDDAVRGLFTLGDTLTIGGQLEYKDKTRFDRDLNSAQDDARRDREASLRLEAVWEPSERFFMLGSTRVRDFRRADEANADVHDSQVLLNELYGHWRDALDLGWDVQVGRQDFDERREWLYDQNLDALRFIHGSPALRVELSVSTTLSDGSPRDENTDNWIAYVSNNDARRELAAYVIDREEHDGDRTTHVGARALGEWLPRNESWLEAAWLGGYEGVTRLDAWGFDVGTTWEPNDHGPWLTVGWAWGSGDGTLGGTFRQTGLNDNTDKFGGITTLQYYGELFDPELSNLSIATVGVGLRAWRTSSLDLVLHHYDQVEAVDSLVNTGLRHKPDGAHTDLGWEADLVLGSRALRDWLLEIVVGYFRPGDAFPGADDAWLTAFQLRYKF